MRSFSRILICAASLVGALALAPLSTSRAQPSTCPQLTINGPDRMINDSDNGIGVEKASIVVENCRAILHWDTVSIADGCANASTRDGPFLSVVPVDAQNRGTQGPISMGQTAPKNGRGHNSADVTRKVDMSTIGNAKSLQLGLGGGDSCSNKHRR
jgi:hypothetical protein